MASPPPAREVIAEDVAQASLHHAGALKTTADVTAATSPQHSADGWYRLSRSLPRGKNAGKNFSGLPPCRKTAFDHRLGHDSGKNRRPGREMAGKPENPPIAAWHHLIVAIILIH
jgi:hypothetical protein